MQIAHVDGRWIAVTKEGDWWGDTIYLDQAPSPTGPWTTEEVLTPTPLGPDHNTYFASLVPGAARQIVVGLSNNRWDGQRSDTYHPTFRTLPLSRWGAADDPDEPDRTPRPASDRRCVRHRSLDAFGRGSHTLVMQESRPKRRADATCETRARSTGAIAVSPAGRLGGPSAAASR